MNLRTERLLLGMAMGCAAVAVVGWRAALPEDLPDQPLPTDVSVGTPSTAHLTAGEEALRVVSSDPFRLARRPAAVPFAAASVATGPLPQHAPLPELRLTGILGPPWRAVVEGAPGVEQGVLVAPGDSIAAIRIKSISANAVTFRTPDTTWTLTLRRPR